MGKSKPYLSIACICEKALFEADQVATLVRVVGKFVLMPPAVVPAGIPMGFPVLLFIALKGGEFSGKGNVTIQTKRPDGTEADKTVTEIELKTPTSTANIRGEFNIVNPQSGTYWFSVSWNGELLTKIPLDVEITTPGQPPAAIATVPRPLPN